MKTWPHPFLHLPDLTASRNSPRNRSLISRGASRKRRTRSHLSPDRTVVIGTHLTRMSRSPTVTWRLGKACPSSTAIFLREWSPHRWRIWTHTMWTRKWVVTQAKCTTQLQDYKICISLSQTSNRWNVYPFPCFGHLKLTNHQNRFSIHISVS